MEMEDRRLHHRHRHHWFRPAKAKRKKTRLDQRGDFEEAIFSLQLRCLLRRRLSAFYDCTVDSVLNPRRGWKRQAIRVMYLVSGSVSAIDQ